MMSSCMIPLKTKVIRLVPIREQEGHIPSLLLIEITIDLTLNVDMSQAPDVNGLIPGSPEGLDPFNS